jgi:hypothetical protein
MIHPTPIRELNLAPQSDETRPTHLAAASGLVQVADTLYVVADDEHHLGVFHATNGAPGHLVRLFEGNLPEKAKKRKATKPDLETLLALPAFDGFAHGALLALGSGSKPNRETAVLLAIGATGLNGIAPQHIDLTGLYDDLRDEMDALNIEGAAIIGNTCCLLQRGNKGTENALIRMPLDSFLQDLARAKSPRLRHAPQVQIYDLGAVDGVPLCFTDGAVLPSGALLFTAVAEDTDNSIDDGACKGSAIGLIDALGKLVRVERVSPTYKVEGITASVRNNVIHLQMVTDDDDASKPACLLAAELDWV